MVIYTANNSVAITFDDGPNPKVTPLLLDILKEKDVKVTFFLIGARVEEYPEIVKRIVAEGHDIGNHSYTHKRLAQLLRERGSDEAFLEIKKGHEVIKNIAGITDKELLYFRPPYLDWDENIGDLAKALYGDRIVLAHSDIGDYDWGDDHSWNENDLEAINTKSKEIIDYWNNHLNNGSIATFHDSAEYNLPGNKDLEGWENRALPTLKAIPTIIDNIRKKDLEIKKLRELDLKTEQLR
jgi:peptidoglycan/xylan/chitin deacetylase (PgdA/CDA1 family)